MTQKLKLELSSSSVEAEETDQQKGQVVQFFSCTACAKFSTEIQQEMWDHMFSAHVLPLNPSGHMQSPSWQVPPLRQSTF